MRNKKMIGIFVCILFFGVSIIPNMVINVSALEVNERITTTAQLYCRSSPVINDNILWLASKGSTGEIIDGPESGSDNIWWKIKYDVGIEGWSSEGDGGGSYYIESYSPTYDIANSFQYPLSDTWSPSQDFGHWNSDWGGYHLAEDVLVSPYTPVYTSAAGKVRYISTISSGYGSVIIIEHLLNDGSYVCSLYGHLSKSKGLQVNVGDNVLKGQLIGYIGDSSENGGSTPHIHFGIRKGGYSTENNYCGNWLYVGYSKEGTGCTHEQYRDMWHDPSNFISTPKKGDVVFVFDATGSMRWIIENMQSKAVSIMNDIKSSISDTRFGVGSFTDYPSYYSSYGYSSSYGSSGDYAWHMDEDLTDDVNSVKSAINSVIYGYGADGPEDYTRAVFETINFNWRADAIKIVVLFGDAPPHSAPSGQTMMCPWDISEKLFTSSYGGDPGNDKIMFTDDDLDYGPVVDKVVDEDIIFISVDCQSSSSGGYAKDAHNNFHYLAYKTGGSIFGYDSEEVANEIISRVTEEELSIYFVHLTDLHYGKKGARNRVKGMIEDISELQPKPAFVVLSGDLIDQGDESGKNNWFLRRFLEVENNSYEVLKNDLEILTNNGIPYYICPGNHNYYKLYCNTEDLDEYNNAFSSIFDPDEDNRYSITIDKTHIISINSGWDASKITYEGTGLTLDDINWLKNDLDMLDGEINNQDESEYNKIIFMHHPIINYRGIFIDYWGAQCITNYKSNFIDLCDNYDVDLVLSGHTHNSIVYEKNMDYSSDPLNWDGFRSSEFPLSTFDKTLYAITADSATNCAYRMIKCKTDRTIVYEDDVTISTITGTIHGCPVELHLYDSYGNHVGMNETEGIDFEIENVIYSIMPLDDTLEIDPKLWVHSMEQISLPYGIDNYWFEFIGTGDGVFNFSIIKHLVDGGYVRLLYTNVPVTSDSIGIMYIDDDSIDYSIYIDDDGDGIIDYEIQPSIVISNNAPYRPKKPSGPTDGNIGESYLYTTSTVDPEGDHIYYWFDWGDGTSSNWIGPYYSGDTVNVLHTWSTYGEYEVRVKARDGWGHESDWSPSLIFEMDSFPPAINIVVPSVDQALQDGVTFEAEVYDSSGVDWVTFSIREPDGGTGIVIDPAYESMSATDMGGDVWQLNFDTTQLPDGYYLLMCEACDIPGNQGHETVEFSIRNWAVVELLPSTENHKAGRTMPVKFSIRVVEAVDPAMPFVWNEDLTILIYEDGHPGDILQESSYGDTSKDYRISSEEEQYITNFKTIKKIPKTYVVEIWRNDMLLDSFEFETVK